VLAGGDDGFRERAPGVVLHVRDADLHTLGRELRDELCAETVAPPLTNATGPTRFRETADSVIDPA